MSFLSSTEQPNNNQIRGNKNWFMRHEVLYIILGILLLVVIVGSVFWWKEIKKGTGFRLQVTENTETTNLKPETLFSDWKTYTNTEYGFEFKYPEKVFQSKTDERGLIGFNGSLGLKDKIDIGEGIKLIHSIPVEYCDESGLPGHCWPTTEDITVGIYVTNTDYETIYNNYSKSFGGLLTEIVINETKGFSVSFGVEGEGTVEHILPFKDKSLVITRSFIDENNLTVYQKYSDFIPIREQEKLFNQILSTFTFTIPRSDAIDPRTFDTNIANWKTYKNSQYGFEFKYPKELLIRDNPSSKSLIVLGNTRQDFWNEHGFIVSVDVENTPVENDPELRLSNIDITQLAKNTGKKVSVNFVGDSPNGSYSISLDLGDGKYLHIHGDIGHSDDPRYGGNNIFSQILSTFKFIDN